MTKPTTMTGLLAASAILGVAGPFQSSEVLALVPRLLYWLVIVVSSYSCGYLVDALFRPALKARPIWQIVLALGVITGIGVTLIVLVMNIAIFGIFPPLKALPSFVLPIVAISMIISIAGEVYGRSPNRATTIQSPPLLDRLPFEKRGTLVSLSVEDHYVRIQTVQGESLVLLRLSDAIREVGDTAGAQVHRSHWVAWDAITAARREGDRAILTLKTGTEIPVSRANLGKIKDAGFLPK